MGIHSTTLVQRGSGFTPSRGWTLSFFLPPDSWLVFARVWPLGPLPLPLPPSPFCRSAGQPKGARPALGQKGEGGRGRGNDACVAQNAAFRNWWHTWPHSGTPLYIVSTDGPWAMGAMGPPIGWGYSPLGLSELRIHSTTLVQIGLCHGEKSRGIENPQCHFSTEGLCHWENV